MNKNIDKMISLIIEDQELCETLILQKSLNDTYEFCKSVSGGYTKKEFEEFLDKILDYDESLLEELDDENMANVAGGAGNNMYAKALAYSLSAITMVSSVYAGATSNVSQFEPTSKHQYTQSTKKSFWNKYKKIIIGLGLTGVALLAAGSVYNWKRKNDSQAGVQGQKNQSPKDASVKKKKSPKHASVKKKKSKRKTHLAKDKYKDDTSSRASQLYTDFKNSIYNVRGFGSAFAIAGIGTYILSDVASISSKFCKTYNATWPIQSMINKISDFRKSLEKKMNYEELSLNDAFGNLDYLFDELKGQEKAKEQIKSIVYGILHRKNQAKLSGKKYDRGDVLYFTGPSGVGKTLMARGLAKYKILTSNVEPFYTSASEVDKDSKETVMDQLFGFNSYGYREYDEYSSGNNRVSTPKNLVKYLNNNPDGVVIIDEYDKMWSPNLDEIFRTIMDHGIVNVKGQTIDCSGITFILTSNESTKSIQGGNQDEAKEVEVDDGTGSRTLVKHDKSFLNRLQPVEFSNLSSEEYIKIIQKEFKDDLVGYWASPEVNGIEIVIDDKCLLNMSELVEKKNQGARYIIKLQSDLFRDISIKVFDAEIKEKDFYRGKKIFVEFNPATEVFTLKDDTTE